MSLLRRESVEKGLRPRARPTNLVAAVSRPSTTQSARSSRVTDRARLVFASGDFDAPGRTRFVERALAWITPLAERLGRAGVVVEAAPLPAAESHAIALRRPGLGPRAALVLDVDDTGVEAALELPAAAPEIELLRVQLQNEVAAARMTAALANLPEPIALKFDGEPELPVHSLEHAALLLVVRRASEESRRLRIGFRVPRAAALAEDALAEQLEGALAALAVPFTLLEAPLSARPALFRQPLRHACDRGGEKGAREATKPIAVGSRVRIRSGPFEGQDGVVETLDGKGGARVRLGLLATRLEVAELTPRAERPRKAAPGRVVVSKRPALVSSHRRR